MLDEREQRLWDDIERAYDARHDGGRRQLPAPIIGGVWAAIFLVLFGVGTVAAAVAGLTAVMWLLWRFLPRVGATRDSSSADAPVAIEEDPSLLWHRSAREERAR